MIHEPDPETGLYLPATATRPSTSEPGPSSEPSVPDTVPASWLGRGPEDTAPIDVVDQDAPETASDAEPEPVVADPQPERKPEPPAQEAPELVRPNKPEPDRDDALQRFATWFSKLVWLAVAAGLGGQVVGWADVFGGTIPGYIVAVVVGGVFEYVMVAASSRGMVDLGDGYSKWQVAVFLAIGTVCAAFAVAMILVHFTAGPLPELGLTEHQAASTGVAAAGAAALGYCAHLASHFPVELANRRRLRAWEAADKQWCDEEKQRQQRRRALHDEVEAQRLRAAVPTTPAQPAADPEPVPAPKPKPKPKPKSKAKATGKSAGGTSRKPSKADAVAFARDHGITTGPELRDAMRDAGWDTTAPSRQSWHNWARDAQT